MSFFNQLKNKAEELGRKHNLIPQGHQHQHQPQPQGYGPPPQQNHYPSQSYQYPGQHQYQQPYQQQTPPPGQWQQSPPPPQPAYGGHPYAQAPPPAVPLHSRPGGGDGAGGSAPPVPPHPSGYGGQPQVYWRPDFRPEIPVGHEFEQKEGHGEPWGWGNNELQNYTSGPANSFHTADGRLVVRAVARPGLPDPEARYTSARLVTRQTLGRPDGCVTAWLSLPCAEGVWPAFWALPREPFHWPDEGEVDLAEAWNGDRVNHSCLHWGHYTPEDAAKHLVRPTHIPDMSARPVRFDFAWRCAGTPTAPGGRSAGGGRLMWYVDGRPVMRNIMPAGTRPIEDWCLLLNVAMGGNVCQGKVPAEGAYDLVVHSLQMSEAPEGGWGRFDADWQHCPDGAIM